MPVLKHAKKKLRQDKKRTLRNKKVRSLYKQLIKKARESKTPEAVSAAFKQIDKAAKNHIIHDNKAAHLKSSLSKVISGKTPAKTESEPAKKKTETKPKTPKTAKTTKAATK